MVIRCCPLQGIGEALPGPQGVVIGDSPVEVARSFDAHPATSRPPPSRVLEFTPQDPGRTPSSTAGHHQPSSATKAPAGAQSSPHGSSPDAQSDAQAHLPSSHDAPHDPNQDVWTLIAKAGAARLAQMDQGPRYNADQPAEQPQEAPTDSPGAEVVGKRALQGEADGRHVSKRLRVSPQPGEGTAHGGAAHAHNLDTIPDSEDPQQQLPGPSMQSPHSADVGDQHPAADRLNPEHPSSGPHGLVEGHQGGQDADLKHAAKLQFKSTSKLESGRTSGAAAADSDGGSDRSHSSAVPDGSSSPELCRATRSGLRPLEWASARIVGESFPPPGICVHGFEHVGSPLAVCCCDDLKRESSCCRWRAAMSNPSLLAAFCKRASWKTSNGLPPTCLSCPLEVMQIPFIVLIACQGFDSALNLHS